MMMVCCARCRAQVAAMPGYASVHCPYCGNVTPLGMGPMMVAAHAFMPAKCSRTTYVLLGLFFGGLGIHNFVAGRVGSGVAQLLITLLTGWLLLPLIVVGLWVLIELCVVNTDGNGVKMT